MVHVILGNEMLITQLLMTPMFVATPDLVRLQLHTVASVKKVKHCVRITRSPLKRKNIGITRSSSLETEKKEDQRILNIKSCLHLFNA